MTLANEDKGGVTLLLRAARYLADSTHLVSALQPRELLLITQPTRCQHLCAVGSHNPCGLTDVKNLARCPDCLAQA